jgi:hypothetical protein
MQETPAKPRKTNHSSTISERITAVSSLALAVLGLVALIFTWRQITEMRVESKTQVDEMREEAKVQHLTALIDKFDSQEWVVDRETLARKRLDKTQTHLLTLDVNNVPIELLDELGFCEDIGLLTRRGYLDRHDVWNEFGNWILYLYADARPYVDSVQKDSPVEYKECSDLAESTASIEQKEGAGSDNHLTGDDILSGYLGDIERHPGQAQYRGKPHRNH